MKTYQEGYSDKKRFVIVFISITIFLTIIALVFPSIFATHDNTRINPNTVDVPPISTIIQDQNGEAHNIQATLSVEFENDSSNIDPKTLQSQITVIMGQLEFEKMNDINNVSYIKEVIMTKLNSNLPENQIKSIYIAELQSADSKIPTPTPEQNSQRDAVLKGLFKKMK